MMLSGFLFLLLLKALDGKSNESCRHRDVLRHLNITDNEDAMTRPGPNSPLKIELDVLLYAILDVDEKRQQFVSYLWVDMSWENDDLNWNPDEFCGIKRIYLPTKLLWQPDLTIEEMTEKDKTLPSFQLIVDHNGTVMLRNDMVLVSTCRMRIYQFPFDVQSCTLSFKSITHLDEDLQFFPQADPIWNNDWSRRMMQAQNEWLFIDMTVNNKTVNNFGFNQSMLVYTINMKRRSALYIANLLVPILFFFCLDLASFLISHKGGEKLSFKVTVLLAVTVMQLILNDILPASANRIPLIVVYCIGIFGLMMLSLMETILIMHLVEKDNEADKDQILSNDFGDKLEKDSFQNSSRVAGYWTRVSKTINKVFFIFYLIAATVFFLCLYFLWRRVEKW
ncbi:5-hydroxytryptamine receptor 3A-like [Gymnodraco acuticeps]|uniref:5-hydroxytryptamine receptor 3A-like n=1 Tax=Gymnodraco acuticeps TaxID=8218 RepID=A0A6P8UFM2_GYMAC|nr:5-hydroxytryptamine receptor 3A-like [Gymnodraco acuticeps]